MKRSERAVELFKEGYNCSQSVFGAFADLYVMDFETAMKVSASFGGGLGRMREVCGTVSGMALAIGMETGAVQGKDTARKKANYEKVQKLTNAFREQNGTIYCKELLGLTKKQQEEETAEPAARTEEYYRKRPCLQLIRMAAELLEKEFHYEDEV